MRRVESEDEWLKPLKWFILFKTCAVNNLGKVSKMGVLSLKRKGK